MSLLRLRCNPPIPNLCVLPPWGLLVQPGNPRRLTIFLRRRVSRRQALAKLVEPSVGVLKTRLAMAEMFAHQGEFIAKFSEIFLQPAGITDDLFGAAFDLHAPEPQHDRLQIYAKRIRRHRNHMFAKREAR